VEIILTVVIIASVLAYLFLPARERDSDGNPIIRAPKKAAPPPAQSQPEIAPYRRPKPKRSTPTEPQTFRGKGPLTTAPFALDEGLYQVTTQCAPEQTVTVSLRPEDDESARQLPAASGLTKQRISIDHEGQYRIEVECGTEVTWAVLVKGL
jgi:hypothetical protein